MNRIISSLSPIFTPILLHPYANHSFNPSTLSPSPSPLSFLPPPIPPLLSPFFLPPLLPPPFYSLPLPASSTPSLSLRIFPFALCRLFPLSGAPVIEDNAAIPPSSVCSSTDHWSRHRQFPEISLVDTTRISVKIHETNSDFF